MKIKIEINELVLHGVNYHDHRRIGTAIEQELTKLISNRGLPEGFVDNSRTPSIDAGSFNIKKENPSAIGVEVAKSIFNAWGASKAVR